MPILFLFVSVSLFMHPFHSTATRVVHPLEGSIPLQCDGCAAGNASLTWYGAGGTLAWEVFGKN